MIIESPILTFLRAWLGIAIILDLYVVKEDVKATVVSWLKQKPGNRLIQKFPAVVNLVLISVFGERFLSTRRIVAIFLVTMIMRCVLLFTVWGFLDKEVKDVLILALAQSGFESQSIAIG